MYNPSRHRRRRPRAAMSGLAVLAVVAGLGTLTACSQDDEPSTVGAGEGSTPILTSPRPTARPSTTTARASTTSTTMATTMTVGDGSTAAALDQRCENPTGFSVAYPAGWSTNVEPVPEPCVWFSPTAIVVPTAATDELVGPISIRIQQGASLADVRDPDPMYEQVTSSAELTVAGRPAVRIDSVATGEGLLVAGTRIVSYAVDVAPASDGTPQVLTATAIECCGVTMDAAVPTLDAMIATLTITA